MFSINNIVCAYCHRIQSCSKIAIRCFFNNVESTISRVDTVFICERCCDNDKLYVNVKCNFEMYLHLNRMILACMITINGKHKCHEKGCPCMQRTCLRMFVEEFETNDISILSRLDKFCTYCDAINVRYRCGGCNLARYCNKDCMNKDWKRHKHVCKPSLLIIDKIRTKSSKSQ